MDVRFAGCMHVVTWQPEEDGRKRASPEEREDFVFHFLSKAIDRAIREQVKESGEFFVHNGYVSPVDDPEEEVRLARRSARQQRFQLMVTATPRAVRRKDGTPVKRNIRRLTLWLAAREAIETALQGISKENVGFVPAGKYEAEFEFAVALMMNWYYLLPTDIVRYWSRAPETASVLNLNSTS